MRLLTAAGLLVVSSAFGANALFPTPLHIVRRVEDPLARKTSTIEEYCSGNRIVTIHGSRVAISDFGEQTLTEIDHARFTYSITRFDEIASARMPSVSKDAGGTRRQITVNHSIALSREAIEALIGAAYPNRRTPAHDEILHAAGNARTGRIAAESAATQPTYGLPSQETITYENGLTSSNVVVQVDEDLPPASAILIDPGAVRVESRLTRLRRELEQLDKLPSSHP